MESSPQTRRRLTLSLCAFAYAIVYTGRQNLSIASPLLQADGIMDSAAVGMMGSAFFFVYAVGRLCNGYIGDRVSRRAMLTLGMLAAGACNLGLVFLPPVPAMLMLWGANGFFQSMLWGPALGMVVTAYEGTPEKERATMTMSTGVGLGSLLAVLVAVGSAALGVRAVFAIPAGLILFAGLLLFLLPRSVDGRAGQGGVGLRTLLRDGTLWRLILPAAAHGAVKDNLILWLPALFMDWYALDLGNAAFFVFLMPLANFIGRLIFPFCFGLLGRRKTPMLILSFALCTAAVLPVIAGIPAAPITACLMAVIAVATTWINAVFITLYPADFADRGCVSTVAGLMDAATYTGSAIGSAAFGVLTAAAGYGAMFAVWGAVSLLSLGLVALGRSRR